MRSDYVWAIVGFVIVAIVGISLLYLGAQGALPTGFGLFDMSNTGVRIIVIVVLGLITAALFAAYNSVRKK